MPAGANASVFLPLNHEIAIGACHGCSVQDGKYCLVWGGTHEHSWMRPEKLANFRTEVPEYTALIPSAKKASFRAALEEAESGRLKEWDRIKTTQDSAGPAAAAERSKKWYWTEEEELALVRLVEEEGSGDWEGKVKRLGTSRTVSSVKSRWLDNIVPRLQANNGRYKFQAPARFADQPGELWRKDDTCMQGVQHFFRTDREASKADSKRAVSSSSGAAAWVRQTA